MGIYKFDIQHDGRNYRLVFNVMTVRHGPLLSRNACLKLGLLKLGEEVKVLNKISEGVSQENVKITRQIIQKYSGRFKGEVKLQVDNDIKPSIQAPRRHPLAKQKQPREEINKLVSEGIIVKEEEHTEWCSNVMLLEQNNKTRLVLDPIQLNKALLRPNYQFTTVEEILPSISKAKIFSKLDARKGFWQVVLDEESSRLTTFWTPFGRYRWKRMPFGISPANEIFQHKQNEILSGLKGVEAIADDLLVYGVGDTLDEAVKDHNKNLENLLERLEKKGCKLNKYKMI